MFGFNHEKAKKAVKAGILAAVGLTAATPTSGQELKTQNKVKPDMETNLPTRQDSLDLLKNSQKILNYYENKNAYHNAETKPVSNQVFDKMMRDRERFLKQKSIRTESGDLKPENIQYFFDVDQNKFFQKESYFNVLDRNAPVPLYDKRIKPQNEVLYKNWKNEDPLKGDWVGINMYDPLAVKPYDLLTSEEKELRKQKYGTAGFPEEKEFKDKSEQKFVESAVEKYKYIPPLGSTLIPTQFPNISILKDKEGNVGYINTQTGEQALFGDEGIFITKEQQTIRTDGGTTFEDPSIFKKSKETKAEDMGGKTVTN